MLPHLPECKTRPLSNLDNKMGVRLFVGGLPSDISAADLSSRFSPFGKVSSVEIIPSKENDLSGTQKALSGRGAPQSLPAPAPCRGFAYVEFEPKASGGVL